MNSKKESDSKDIDYVKRKEEFTTKLLAFHRARSNPIRRFPLLGGRELDLYHLYSKVQEMGGSEIVTKERNWGEVSRSFNLPSTVTSASYACRQNYSKFLLEYEQYENHVSSTKTPSMIRKPSLVDQSPFSFPTPSTPISVPPVHPSPAPPQSATVMPNAASLSQTSLSMLSLHLSNLLSLPGLQGLGNLLDQLGRAPNQLQILSNMLNLPPNQVQLLELLMKQRQKQLQLLQGSECGRYDWLIRSLQSGFPNEVDFTLNILLIMSFDDKAVIDLSKVPQLVDVLLAHVGVFTEGDPYLEKLYQEEWHATDEVDYHRMWEESVPTHVYSLLLNSTQQPSGHFNLLFPLRSIVSNEHIESFRVSQVSMIIRNLSFDEVNGKFLASQEAVLRFLLLGINCILPMISNHCLDALSVIAPHLSLKQYDDCFNECNLTRLLMSSLQEFILSDDRQLILKAIECIGSLSYSSGNIGALCQLTPEVISRIFQCLLLIDDVQLVLTCLDALYCITFLGNAIARTVLECNDHSVDTLIDLITLDYKDSPPRNIVGQLSILHQDGKEEPVVMTTKPLTMTSEPSPITTDPSHILPAEPVKVDSVQSADSSKINMSKPGNVVETTTPLNTTTPHRKPKAEHKVKLKNLFSVKTSVDSSKLSFGKQWLQVFYKVNPDEFVSKSEMYSQYLSSCAHLKVITAATQAEFDLILKETFPNITFTNIKLSGQDIQLVGGVAKNSLPNTVNHHKTISKQDPINASRGSSSLTPSRSPSPTPATPPLSPLQQLIQQTKSKTSNTISIPKASPLLVSSKMSSNSNAFQVEKTGSSSDSNGQLKESLEHNKLLNGLSSSKPVVNGNISKEEKKSLRKRCLNSDHNYTIPKMKQAKLADVCDSNDSPTCSTTPPITAPSHMSTSSTSTCTRSSSLPPYFSNNNNLSSDQSKARSLTPPSPPPLPLSTAELLLDTLKVVKSVKSTSVNETVTSKGSVQGSTGLICLWNNCLKIRNSPYDLFSHVVYDHISAPQSVHAVCEWSGCSSKARRMLPSLLRHIQIHHCSGSYSSANRPTPPNAAQTLLRLRTVPKWEVDEESCIGKTIHLTSALVLRNLLETVPHAKLRVSQYESVLTQVAFSSSEASGAAAQCLYLLTSQCSSSDHCSPSKQFCS